MYERAHIAGLLLTAGSLMAPAPAWPADADHVLWRQCDEDAAAMDVDPGGLQERIGPEFPVAVDDGKAQISFLFQDCSEYRIDGRDYGSTRDLHVLVRLDGGGDVRPVIGAPETLPTMRWFQLFAGTDNNRVRRAWEETGRSIESIEELSVSTGRRRRSGSAIVDGHLSFAWEIDSEPATAPLVGVNHDIYARDAEGKILVIRVQAVAFLSTGISPGTLDVAGENGERVFVRSGRHAVSMLSPQPMRARATIGPLTD